MMPLFREGWVGVGTSLVIMDDAPDAALLALEALDTDELTIVVAECIAVKVIFFGTVILTLSNPTTNPREIQKRGSHIPPIQSINRAPRLQKRTRLVDIDLRRTSGNPGGGRVPQLQPVQAINLTPSTQEIPMSPLPV